MRKLNIELDGYHISSTFCITPSDYIDARVLAAGVAEVITVPALAKKVLFSGSGVFYTRYNAAAAIPAADVTDGSASAMNPSGWTVAAADTIGIIAPADCIVTLEFFS